MSRDDETVFGRWSRRKRAARAAPAPGPARPAPPAPPETPEAPVDEAAWLAEHDLPDPETLGRGDDFSAFLKDTVPDLIRRRALRRLWAANPALANLDGLVEYGEDYTDSAMVPEIVATAYKVGRGFIKKTLDEADLRVPTDAAGQPDGINQESAAVRPPEAAAAREVEAAEAHLPDESSDDPQPTENEEEIAFRPRRMTFVTDGPPK